MVDSLVASFDCSSSCTTLPLLLSFFSEKNTKRHSRNTSFLHLISVMEIVELGLVIVRKLTRLLQNFNLFPSVPPTTDENQLRNQRISTRLFIFLLVLSLTILVMYTSLVTITKTATIPGSSFQRYLQFASRFSKTLTCPCTKISINYEKILRVTYNLHQVCTSDFVTENWTDYLSLQSESVSNFDCRATSVFTFQSLRILCQSVNTTITDSLNSFYSSQYITASVTPSEIFQSQTESLVQQFISSTTNTYRLSLQMIRDTTQANALLSGLEKNYNLYVEYGKPTVLIAVQTYSGCDCAAKATCVQQSAIYAYPSQTVLFNVPGMNVGCLPLEALLQSSLQCFYNQTCIVQLQLYIYSTAPMNPRALNSSLQSQYLPNATIQLLLDQLMVERWNWSSMYESYYGECQPEECSYTYETKNDAIYIITTVIGLFGGLVTVLKLIVPYVVKLVRRKYRRGTSETGKKKRIRAFKKEKSVSSLGVNSPAECNIEL